MLHPILNDIEQYLAEEVPSIAASSDNKAQPSTPTQNRDATLNDIVNKLETIIKSQEAKDKLVDELALNQNEEGFKKAYFLLFDLINVCKGKNKDVSFLSDFLANDLITSYVAKISNIDREELVNIKNIQAELKVKEQELKDKEIKPDEEQLKKEEMEFFKGIMKNPTEEQSKKEEMEFKAILALREVQDKVKELKGKTKGFPEKVTAFKDKIISERTISKLQQSLIKAEKDLESLQQQASLQKQGSMPTNPIAKKPESSSSLPRSSSGVISFIKNKATQAVTHVRNASSSFFGVSDSFSSQAPVETTVANIPVGNNTTNGSNSAQTSVKDVSPRRHEVSNFAIGQIPADLAQYAEDATKDYLSKLKAMIANKTITNECSGFIEQAYSKINILGKDKQTDYFHTLAEYTVRIIKPYYEIYDNSIFSADRDKIKARFKSLVHNYNKLIPSLVLQRVKDLFERKSDAEANIKELVVLCPTDELKAFLLEHICQSALKMTELEDKRRSKIVNNIKNITKLIKIFDDSTIKADLYKNLTAKLNEQELLLEELKQAIISSADNQNLSINSAAPSSSSSENKTQHAPVKSKTNTLGSMIGKFESNIKDADQDESENSTPASPVKHEALQQPEQKTSPKKKIIIKKFFDEVVKAGDTEIKSLDSWLDVPEGSDTVRVDKVETIIEQEVEETIEPLQRKTVRK